MNVAKRISFALVLLSLFVGISFALSCWIQATDLNAVPNHVNAGEDVELNVVIKNRGEQTLIRERVEFDVPCGHVVGGSQHYYYYDISPCHSLTVKEIWDTSGCSYGQKTVRAKAVGWCDSVSCQGYQPWVYDTVYIEPEEKYCENPYGEEGDSRCDYALRQYMVCEDGEWQCHDHGAYCSHCDHCGDGVCNCDETYSSCPSDCEPECDAGYLLDYRCDGDWRQRKYQRSDCSTIWKNYEYCDYGCYNGYCLDAEEDECDYCDIDVDVSTPSCVCKGEKVETTISIDNNGCDSEHVSLRAYLCKVSSNGRIYDCKRMSCDNSRVYVRSGRTKTVDCDMKAKDCGKHKIKVVYEACDDDPVVYSRTFYIGCCCHSCSYDCCDSGCDCRVNCDNKDGYVGARYCKNGNVYRKYRDYYYSKSRNVCLYTEKEVKIENCAGGCSDGFCVPVCSAAACDKKDGFVGDSYCSGGNVYQVYRDYYCSSQQGCLYKDVEKLKQACPAGCLNGQCITTSCKDICGDWVECGDQQKKRTCVEYYWSNGHCVEGEKYTVYSTNAGDMESIDLGRINVFSGLVFGKHYERFGFEGRGKMVLKIDMKKTNSIKPLNIILNGKVISSDVYYKGKYEIELSGLKDMNTIEFVPVSSGWQLWVPTFYEFYAEIEYQN